MASLWVLALVFIAGTVCSAQPTPDRIVGGEVTSVEEYPSIVQVDFNLFGWGQSCAGTAVSNLYIVSAAHCFAGIFFGGPSSRRIRAGSSFRNRDGVLHPVSAVFNHPSYGSNNIDGDLSVVRLSFALEFGPTISSSSIINQGANLPNNLPVVHAGWGATSVGGPASNVLLDVLIYTVDTEECRQRYLNAPSPGFVTDNMICAGILDVGGKDACQGDSGGPLFYQDILVGVVSWGYRCAEARWPGVSTRIASYTNWIQETAV